MDLPQPIDYNFTLNYVNLLNVNFSQDTITIPNKPNTLDKIRCMNDNIKLIFSPIHENILDDGLHCNIYVSGFFGKEMEKSDISYMYPPQIPLIEVVDTSEEELNPYITINNRRLYQIYLLLYSIANTSLNDDKIDEMFIDSKYMNNINGVNIFVLIDIFKRRLHMLGIIVHEIYIPVIIHKMDDIAPVYLFPPSEDRHTWKSFLDERIKRQNLFCKINVTKQSPCPPGMLVNYFAKGSPVVPYFGTKKGFSYTDPEDYQKAIEPIRLTFTSTTSGDYARLLNIFGLSVEKKNSSNGRIERTVVETLSRNEKNSVLKKLKLFDSLIETITTCYHRPINNTDTYLAKIIPRDNENVIIPLHNLNKETLSRGKRKTKHKKIRKYRRKSKRL